MVKFVKSMKEQPTSYTRDIKLPDDFTSDIPPKGLAWLYRYGITEEEMTTYGIGYGSKSGRVILPVYDGNDLIYYQGRLLTTPTKERPKYTNVWSQGRDDIYFHVTREDNSPDKVVLVEDILSSIVVGRVVDCTALLSVIVHDKLMFSLRDQGKTVYIWLDSNMLKRVIKYVSRYRLLGVDCRMIHTSKDPKYYSSNEIERRIDEVN